MIQSAVEILKKSKSLFILTGAGISAESGIPTFRGADGLWKNYSATDLATPQAFAQDPELVWEWYHWRQSIILKAKPNPAHYAIVELEKRFKDFLLLTQNVDNLHHRAGSQNVLELHGNIFRARCLDCARVITHQIFKSPLSPPLQKGDSSPVIARDEVPKFRPLVENPRIAGQSPEERATKLPKCPCGGLLRPDVIWFGEPIPQDIWQRAIEFLTNSDVALICGTSSVVWPAAAIPEMAKKNGIRTIEINLEPTPITDIVDVSLSGKAGELLPQIIEKLKA